MELIKKMSMFMLNETKTKVSPLLNSIYKKQDNIDKAEAEALVKALDKITDKSTAIVVSHGLPIGKSNAQVIINRSDGEYTEIVNVVETVLSRNGWNVISSAKSDGKRWTVTIKK